MEREWLRERLETGRSYEAIGREAGCSPSKVAYWARKHGLTSPHASRHQARGGIEADVLADLVARGFSVRRIAAELGCGYSTVRHWLTRHGLATSSTERRAAGRAARAAGAEEADLPCPIHGVTRHLRRADGYRCAQCRVEHVTARRRRVKETLVAEAGGRCRLCGYDRCVRAMQFHHVDPATKSFAVSRSGVTISLAALRAEARKCVLLCANCHAEVESGIADLSPIIAASDVYPA